MAYARGLAAGLEMDNIDDLISFANAYGASRLRSELFDNPAIKCNLLDPK